MITDTLLQLLGLFIFIIVFVLIIKKVSKSEDKKQLQRKTQYDSLPLGERLRMDHEKENYNKRMNDDENKITVNRNVSLQWGELNQQMVCPHCQTKGKVRIKLISKKKGISGGKATAAVLTAGWSLLATGLSKKEEMTQAHCDNCNNTWGF